MTTDNQLDTPKQPKSSGRLKWIILLIALLLLGGVGLGIKGSGLPSKIIRLFRPSYGSPKHPPKIGLNKPADFAKNVPLNTTLVVPIVWSKSKVDPEIVPWHVIDPDTISEQSAALVRTWDQKLVETSYELSGGKTLILRPEKPLEPNTNYTLHLTSDLKDVRKLGLVPVVLTFDTAGAADPEIRFDRADQATASPVDARFTCVCISRDHKLYAGCDDGRIFRFEIKPDCSLGIPQVILSLQKANDGPRVLTGFCFDPASTAQKPVIWVSHGYPGFSDPPDFTGKITRMSGADLETVEDVIINLPRSVRDHLNNQPVIGPDGALYWSQPSNTCMGAPDEIWGWRTEHMLTANILRLDLAKATPGKPLDAKTVDAGGPYDPRLPGVPLTIYAEGIRLAYDLLWHSNGHLYVPTNGSSAGGNTPAGNGALAITNVNVAEDDWLFKIVPGKYFGHPNSHLGHFVLNGGNPTNGYDFAEVPQYPIGTKPDPDWVPPAAVLGQHISANGVIEYKSNSFGGKLKGALIICRYNYDNDLLTVRLDDKGDVSAVIPRVTGFTGFNNPLDLVEDETNGNIYVCEYGGKSIALLKPAVARGK